MKNKLIIGTIFCFVLLCMMPMISAVELKTIEKTQANKINTQPEQIFVHKIGNLISNEILPKHPILLIIVEIQLMIRVLRALILETISVVQIPEAPDEIVHPLLYLYSLWLMATFIIEGKYWAKVSDSLGWNWPSFPFLKQIK
jgi:hypothetical protein